MARNPRFALGLFRLRGAVDCLVAELRKKLGRPTGFAPVLRHSQCRVLVYLHFGRHKGGASGRCCPGCILATREAFC